MNKKMLVNNADNNVVIQAHLTNISWNVVEFGQGMEDTDDWDDTYEFYATDYGISYADYGDYEIVTASNNLYVDTIMFNTDISTKYNTQSLYLSIGYDDDIGNSADKIIYVKDYKIELVADGVEVIFTPSNSLVFNGFCMWSTTSQYALLINVPVYLGTFSDLKLKITLTGVSDTPVETVPVSLDASLLSGGTVTDFAIPYGFAIGNTSIYTELDKWDYTDLNYTVADRWAAKTSNGTYKNLYELVTEPLIIYPNAKYKAAPEHGSFTITITPGTHTKTYTSSVDKYWGYTSGPVYGGANPGPSLGSITVSGTFTNADLGTDSELSTRTAVYSPAYIHSGIDIYSRLNFNVFLRYENIQVTMTPDLADTKGYVEPETITGYFRKGNSISFTESAYYHSSSFTDSSHIPLKATTYTATW